MLGMAHAFLARCALAACVIAVLPPSALSEQLYFTEFEAPFTPGPDQWRGTEGWLANNNGLGLHGIDDDQMIPPQCGESCPPPDQTAFLGGSLGGNSPTSSLVIVSKPLDFDPYTREVNTVVIDTLMGIQDSTNGNYDSFWIGIYNSNADFLAGLRFNVDFSIIRRHDGIQEHAIPDGGFFLGELQLVVLEIDYWQNRWRAEIEGVPLFPWVPFSNAGVPLNLGSVSYEWQVNSAPELTNFGDNWMMVVDCAVWAVPPGEPNFHIDQVQFTPGGDPEIEFTGEPGWTYQVQYTSDLQTWHSDLPNSTFSGLLQPTQLFFSDPSNPGPGSRWYRVERSVTP